MWLFSVATRRAPLASRGCAYTEPSTLTWNSWPKSGADTLAGERLTWLGYQPVRRSSALEPMPRLDRFCTTFGLSWLRSELSPPGKADPQAHSKHSPAAHPVRPMPVKFPSAFPVSAEGAPGRAKWEGHVRMRRPRG